MNKEADSSSKCFTAEEVTINSPAENAFKILSDINNWPAWQSSVTKAHMDGLLNPGLNLTGKPEGLKINSELHAVNANSEFG